MLKSIFVFVCVLAAALAKPEPKDEAEDTEANLFILSDGEVPNAAAFLMCDALGMVPVSIETPEKNLDLTRFMSSYDISSAWTSGDDLDARNNYFWRGTGNPFEYVNWLDGAPLADESCRCVAFVSGVHASCGEQISCSGWTVEPCKLLRRVICELPPPSCEGTANKAVKIL